MNNVELRVKGIVKRDDKYLVIKHFIDDRIPEPFMWEFIDGSVNFGESPDDAVRRLIMEKLRAAGSIDRILYTWNNMLGDTQCVGIAYLCHVDDNAEFQLTEEYGGYEWISRSEFGNYIENLYVLKDLEGVEL